MTTELTLLSRVSFRDQEITGPRLRGLLALLADDLRTGCSTTRLVDGLWPQEQPENPTKALQVVVSRARSSLGPDVIASTPTGYRLNLPEDRVDAAAVPLRAAASARRFRAGEFAAALQEAEAGLALWDGPARERPTLDDPLSALRESRAEAHRALVRLRALALSRLGRHAEAVEPLAELAREQPRDEEVLLELLRSEAATSGPSAPLARYDAYRRALRDRLGADPGPALRALHQELLRAGSPAVRHGVLHEPNPLLGRAGDITAVAGMLRTSRVTSIVGPGGLGKTRLAHAVSREASARVVHFVPLAGVGEGDEVAGEVARALGVGEARRGHFGGVRDEVRGIVDVLGTGSTLLVLDNCEHVVEGVADLVRALVAMTGELRVLTTSRAPLGLSSESVYLLPELDLPTTVELFEQRVRAARPGAELPGDVVSRLCARLDGLPLAVELAAARARLLSVAEIAERLENRFALLRGGPRDAPQRHRTLEAVVDWSWNLLGPDAQAAMRVLSVFPGGFTEASARHVLGDADAVLILEDLVDQSLLKVTETASGTRFRMLETVREFSAARREAEGEGERVTAAFLSWARDYGIAYYDLVFRPGELPPLEFIDDEQDNLMQALRQALAREDTATAVAAAAPLISLWMVQSAYGRLMAIVEEISRPLSHFRPTPELVEPARTLAALCAGVTLMLDGPRATRSVVVLRNLPEAPPDTIMRAFGIVLRDPDALRAGDPRLRELCASDAPLLRGVANGVLSYVAAVEDDEDEALAAAERMLAAVDDKDIAWARIMAHSRVGELHLLADRGEEARQRLHTALTQLENLWDWPDMIGIQWGLVLAHLQVGDADEAERWAPVMQYEPDDESITIRSFELAVRAEIDLMRGDVDSGLARWRQTVELLLDTTDPYFRGDPGLEPWTLEIQATTVIAHAQHGRLGEVQSIVERLPRAVSGLLSAGESVSPAHSTTFPLCGALLLALAMVDLDRGAVRSGVRMIALAQRLRYLRQLQPTMSESRAREAAEHADGAAYADAVSEYAALDRADLRAAILAALRDRPNATDRG
ncbi:ATP-binding protein [Prauserella flavalba]|uniref:LuxR family transcriptional regulator n=1 Tax=Prauserella flavalba TaxID=1477506 RepID=A0A318LBQ4_9PSEU|nr:BTAD domain-containing putative transcriptional regulator [Prauserella flavalba]PXY20075.1 LuxR family transcriptional regulator [Prauserella flavalba]